MRALEQHGLEYIHKMYGVTDNIRQPLDKVKYKDVYEAVGKMKPELEEMYKAIDGWMLNNLPK